MSTKIYGPPIYRKVGGHFNPGTLFLGDLARVSAAMDRLHFQHELSEAQRFWYAVGGFVIGFTAVGAIGSGVHAVGYTGWEATGTSLTLGSAVSLTGGYVAQETQTQSAHEAVALGFTLGSIAATAVGTVWELSQIGFRNPLAPMWDPSNYSMEMVSPFDASAHTLVPPSQWEFSVETRSVGEMLEAVVGLFFGP